MSTPSPAEYPLDRAIHWHHLDADERRRQEAMLEFIQTESSYYNRLTVIHEVFYQKSDAILSDSDRKTIFQNIDELLLRSGLLLADLQSRQSEQQGCPSSVADILLLHLKFFDCFRKYCIGHAQGSRLLLQLSEGNGKFAKFIKETLSDPRCSNLDLPSFLLEPVQRVARYPLLIKQILHYTTKDHPDRENVLLALSSSEQCLQSINESVRVAQMQARLQELQDSTMLCTGEDELMLTWEFVGMTRSKRPRELLIEGPLWKCRSKRKLHGILLSDMLVLLEPRGTKYSLYRPAFAVDETALRPINLDAANVKLAPGLSSECCFEIVRGAESVYVAGESKAKIAEWFSEYEKARNALIHGIRPLSRAMALPCIGTVKMTIVSGSNLALGSGLEPYCIIQLNHQKVDINPATGPNPTWNQSKILSLSSFDDTVNISVFNYHKYTPNEPLGHADLSLNFLEYYSERATDKIHISVGKGTITITLQFRPV